MTKKPNEETSEKDVLDLIGSKPKRSAKPKADATAAAPKAAPAKASKPKKEALDLLSGPKKSPKKAVESKEAAPAPVEEEKPVVQEEPKTTAASEPLNIKGSMSVSDLATQLNIKPFQIIKDLMGLGIFANPSTNVEPDNNEQICKIHPAP